MLAPLSLSSLCYDQTSAELNPSGQLFEWGQQNRVLSHFQFAQHLTISSCVSVRMSRY